VAHVVVPDACVLVNAAVRDTILRAAERDLIQVAWSQDILSEMTRALEQDLGLAADKSLKLRSEMEGAFAENLVTGYEPLVPAMKNHPKDRHVLATAVVAGAGSIVTFNVRHFPENACGPYGIQVLEPDTFLLDLWNMWPDEVVSVLQGQAQDLSPAWSLEQLFVRLQRDVPLLVEAIRRSDKFNP